MVYEKKKKQKYISTFSPVAIVSIACVLCIQHELEHATARHHQMPSFSLLKLNSDDNCDERRAALIYCNNPGEQNIDLIHIYGM